MEKNRVQLTLEQQGFEMHGSTQIFFFFEINTCMFLICVQESEDPEGELYAVIQATLYGDLEHLQIWMFVVGPGSNPFWIPINSLSFGEVKHYMWIFDCAGRVLGPLTPCCSRINCICVRRNHRNLEGQYSHYFTKVLKTCFFNYMA